ncbi:MAG: acyl-CoA thioesterase [Boseongicola sp. SB0662_bin_57]|nr:acyl-CoA thioesterase [Boseongicola sp. SB0662_bin_57]
MLVPRRNNQGIRAVAIPAGANLAEDIFGGGLMSQMDLAAGTLAALTSRGRRATVAVGAMKFRRPVRAGSEVSLHASVEAIGRTSMRIHAEAWRRERHGKACEQVAEATSTFVALDTGGKPTLFG